MKDKKFEELQRYLEFIKLWKELFDDDIQGGDFKYIDDGKEDVYIQLTDPEDPDGNSLEINATEWLKEMGLGVDDVDEIK